ncbi:hypothetical protein KC19_2G143200 [Ceratodon purpureus]|uniref:Uncharacterized protein n=1 Tax=Ceratodon purpureus TaxID=3225 RepID=A0A8T0IVE4_CERPU|nr:hypothetical protein KC19_2G143200 [Ceratodon purpureus]
MSRRFGCFTERALNQTKRYPHRATLKHSVLHITHVKKMSVSSEVSSPRAHVCRMSGLRAETAPCGQQGRRRTPYPSHRSDPVWCTQQCCQPRQHNDVTYDRMWDS